MAAILVRPPLASAALLLGLVLLGGHEPVPRVAPQKRFVFDVVLDTPYSVPPSDDILAPPDMADAQDWPHGMIMGRNVQPVDRMDAEVVAHWLSGFLSWLASRAA